MAKLKRNDTTALLPGSIIEAMESPRLFQPWFKGASWDNWKALIKAFNCLPMSASETEFFCSVAGGRSPPKKRPRQIYCAIGRRGAKDSIATEHAAYDAAFFTGQDKLRPGERAQVLIIAPDKETAKLSLGYLQSYFREIPSLAAMIQRTTMSGFELKNRVDCSVVSADFRLTRGRSILTAILTETAFMRDEHSAVPDLELFRALQPGLATLNGRIFCISSPYRKSGLLFDAYQKYFGRDSDDAVFIKAPTTLMNPTIDRAVIDAAYADDPVAAASEWGAEFRDDLRSFVAPEIIDEAILKGRTVLGPRPGAIYSGFLDLSGGRGDSHVAAIAFQDANGIATLACLREVKSPDVEGVVSEFAAILKGYGLREAFADQYAAEWPRSAFQRHGITIHNSPFNRSELYLNLLPMISSGRAKILDIPRLRQQLIALERRTSRTTARDTVDHPQSGSHADDMANSCAGSLVMAARAAMVAPIYAVAAGGDANSGRGFEFYRKLVDDRWVTKSDGTPDVEAMRINAERQAFLGTNWRDQLDMESWHKKHGNKQQ